MYLTSTFPKSCLRIVFVPSFKLLLAVAARQSYVPLLLQSRIVYSKRNSSVSYKSAAARTTACHYDLRSVSSIALCILDSNVVTFAIAVFPEPNACFGSRVPSDFRNTKRRTATKRQCVPESLEFRLANHASKSSFPFDDRNHPKHARTYRLKLPGHVVLGENFVDALWARHIRIEQHGNLSQVQRSKGNQEAKTAGHFAKCSPKCGALASSQGSQLLL